MDVCCVSVYVTYCGNGRINKRKVLPSVESLSFSQIDIKCISEINECLYRHHHSVSIVMIVLLWLDLSDHGPSIDAAR